MKKKYQSFQTTLRNFPAPGQGVHHHILTAAHAGVRNRIPPNTIAHRIRKAIPRPPRPGEIEEAVEKATAYRQRGHGKVLTARCLAPTATRTATPHVDKQRVIANVCTHVKQSGGGMSLDELRHLSPIALGALDNADIQKDNASLLIRTLHRPDALLFCGHLEESGRDFIGTTEQWTEALGWRARPLWVPNPLTGNTGLKSNGDGFSYRCDNATADFPYILFEIDYEEISLETQAAFLLSWIRHGAPIRSIVYSGGKSLHALLEVQCQTRKAWDQLVKKIKPMFISKGADRTTLNSAQLSRLPGHIREETGNLQSLLWLNHPTRFSTNNNP